MARNDSAESFISLDKPDCYFSLFLMECGKVQGNKREENGLP